MRSRYSGRENAIDDDTTKRRAQRVRLLLESRRRALPSTKNQIVRLFGGPFFARKRRRRIESLCPPLPSILLYLSVHKNSYKTLAQLGYSKRAMQQLCCRNAWSAPTKQQRWRRTSTTITTTRFFSSSTASGLRRQRRGWGNKKIDVHTRAGLSENAAGILLLSLIDDIAFIGLTASTSKSAMERLNEGYVGDISTTTSMTTTLFGMLALLGGCVVAASIHPGETTNPGKDEIFIIEKKKKKKKKKEKKTAGLKKTRR